MLSQFERFVEACAIILVSFAVFWVVAWYINEYIIVGFSSDEEGQYKQKRMRESVKVFCRKFGIVTGVILAFFYIRLSAGQENLYEYLFYSGISVSESGSTDYSEDYKIALQNYKDESDQAIRDAADRVLR